MAKISTNLAVISNHTFEAAKFVSLNHHDISSALQTTLEFNKLIPIFSSKLESMLHHSAFIYTNTEFGLEIKNGVFTRHSCTYALKFEEQQLGELKLMRNHRFDNTDLELLETLLCCLIYPLKNATLFHQALKMAYTEPLTQTNNRASEARDQSFSGGISAHIEYNRRFSETKTTATKPNKQVEEECPWAATYYR